MCLVWGGVLNTQSMGRVVIWVRLRTFFTISDSTPGREKMTYLVHEFGKGLKFAQLSTLQSPWRNSWLSLSIFSLNSHFFLATRKVYWARSFQQRRPPVWGKAADLIQESVNRLIGHICSCPSIQCFMSKKGSDFFIAICLILTSVFQLLPIK